MSEKFTDFFLYVNKKWLEKRCFFPLVFGKNTVG